MSDLRKLAEEALRVGALSRRAFGGEPSREEVIARALVAALSVVDAFEDATRSACRCRGTGRYTRDCTLCGDSTYDHECNDEERDCTDPKCAKRRALLTTYREGK